VEEVLRASHIKPWHNSDDRERRDPENGLLLIANLDALFDKFLITFDNDGRMLVSDRIEEGLYRQLGLPGALRLSPTLTQQRFLEYHREEGERRGISYSRPAAPTTLSTPLMIYALCVIVFLDLAQFRRATALAGLGQQAS
jgi:hypothetical protein